MTFFLMHYLWETLSSLLTQPSNTMEKIHLCLRKMTLMSHCLIHSSGSTSLISKRLLNQNASKSNYIKILTLKVTNLSHHHSWSDLTSPSQSSYLPTYFPPLRINCLSQSDKPPLTAQSPTKSLPTGYFQPTWFQSQCHLQHLNHLHLKCHYKKVTQTPLNWASLNSWSH